MARLKLDPHHLPMLTDAEFARLDALTDAQITAAAITDPDNLPLTQDELARMEAASIVRKVCIKARAVKQLREIGGFARDRDST